MTGHDDYVKMILKFENITKDSMHVVYQDKESEEYMHPRMNNFVDDLYKPKDPFDVNKRIFISNDQFGTNSRDMGYLDKFCRLMITYLNPKEYVNPRNDVPVWSLWYENSVHFLWPNNPPIVCVMGFSLYPVNFDITKFETKNYRCWDGV